MSSGRAQDGGLSRAEGAAQRIESMLGDAEPGARLGTKAELRDVCAVSVGTFNEALRLLQMRGHVVVRPGPGGGIFVAEQTPMVRLGNSMLALDSDATSIADAVRIRDALDPLLAVDAMRHSSPADVASYREQIEIMREALGREDPDVFIRANWQLHRLIAEVNPSALLRAIHTALLDIIDAHTVAVLPVQDQPLAWAMSDRYQVHANLVEAIADQDVTALAEAVAAHSSTDHRIAVDLRV